MDSKFVIDRRTGLKLLSGGALAATGLGSLPAFGQPAPEVITITDQLIDAAKKEGQVYYRFSALQQPSEAIAAAFKAKYGIEVTPERRVAAQGTNAFATEERAGRHIVDVHGNSDRKGYIDLSKEGLYARFKVANDGDFDPRNTMPGFGYAPYLSVSILAYNTARLASADAERLFNRTWKGLLDPRFKGGRIGILSPFITSATSLWYWALSESPAYGEKFLQAVAAQDPVIYPDQAVGEEAVFAGEVDMLIGAVFEPVEAALVRGAKMAWIYPDILPATRAVMHFISAKAPHPNAARLFMAWMLSVEGQTTISRDIGRYTTTKVRVPRPPAVQDLLQKSTWYKPYPPEVTFTPSIDEIVEREDGYRRKMAELFKISVRR